MLLSVFTIFEIFATEKSFVLGGNEGWEKFTSTADGLVMTKGLYGYQGWQIAAKNHNVNSKTDLYLSFENEKKTKTSDETGKYTVIEENLYFSSNSAVGTKAGVSRHNDAFIVLMGNKESIFGKAGPTGSFSMEFWLKPSVCVSGENIFFWRSSKNNMQYSDYQTLDVGFMNGKMEWKFLNIFCDVNGKGKDIYVKSSSTILPEKWTHHYLCYDEEEGMIEYYLDGKLEDLVYTTDNGSSYGQFLISDLGTPSKVEICKNFSGSIDEFIISQEIRHFLDTDKEFKYIPSFVSVPLKSEKNGCKIIKVESLSTIPNQTDLQFFIRSSDSSYSMIDEDKLKNGWVKIKDNIPLQQVEGRYFQIAAFFYSDGELEKSPILTQIEIKYEEPDLPIPPSKIYSETKDGMISVFWTNNNMDDRYGYILYYGTKSGSYIGVGLDQGNSPIDCGQKTSITLSGLEVGKIYYFTVASYLKDYPEIIGETTKEIYDRVLR